MERRKALVGIAASGVMGFAQGSVDRKNNTILELKVWNLHNSQEDQGRRVASYLGEGLAPALKKAGVQLDGAFANVIGVGGPYYVTLVQYPDLSAMAEVQTKLKADDTYLQAEKRLASGNGAPFVRVDSSLLRSFDVMPQISTAGAPTEHGGRIFEMRTYEAPSFSALTRKVAMFNDGEAKIFERLGMRPVFFGETFVGPRQPNLTYMLSYDDLGARDRMWQSFVNDPEWRKLSAHPELKDSEIVSNISNQILRALPFSKIR